MRGAVIVPPGGAHEIAHWAVDRNRVASRLHAAKAEVALRVGHEFAPQVHRRLFGILLLVETLGRGVPNIYFGIDYRLAVLILDPAIDEEDRPWCRRSHD